jgi:Icc-related predicted phosphoesterase
MEVAPHEVEALPEDKETTLILAGDCGLFKHVDYAEWTKELSPRFHKILLVAGNHEWYSGKMPTEQVKFETRVDCENVHILKNSSIVIDDVLFLGGTLWTSFRSGNPMMMYDAERFMNDYRKIRMASNGYRKLRATDVLKEHQATRNFLFDGLRAMRDDYEKIVVVTHHAPSCQSISAQYIGDSMNDCYVNNFEYQLMDFGPNLWIHGHLHSSNDYMIGDTQVISNPRGYAFANHNGVRENENKTFDPVLQLTI